MIDHFTLTVSNIKRSKTFYVKALAPLGYAIRMDFGELAGFGDAKKPYFWLKQGDGQPPMHIAFQAKNRAAVDAFHAAAIRAGAKDDGKPGLREHYHPDYYGAFVVDPDGHPIEAVCHLAEGKAARKATHTPAKRTPKQAVRKPAKRVTRK